MKYVITFLLALIPAALWLMVFARKHRINPWTTFFTFVGGILAAQLILLYKGYWNESINLIFFKVDLVDFRANISSFFVDAAIGGFVVFLGIAIMEEFSKFIVMKTLNKGQFRSVDDVIALAIVSALGFSFYENMVYFNAQWGVLDTSAYSLLVISRITIVTMVHMLCSGILGYYFGLAHFASSRAIQEHKKKNRPAFVIFFRDIFRLKKAHLYRDEMMAIGLLLAVGMHAIYNFILSPSTPFNSWVISVLIIAYFFGGYLFLGYLLKKKEYKLQLGLIRSPIEDESNSNRTS